VVTLLLCIKPVRSFANKSPWQFGLALLAISIGLNLSIQNVWDTSQLKFRLPHMLLWMFALGWCVNFCRFQSQRIVTTIALIVSLVLLQESTTLSQTLWVLVGGLVLIWKQYVSIYKAWKMPIQIVSAAAYIIFLTHIAFIRLLESLLGFNYSFLSFCTSVLAGCFIWALPQLFSSLSLKIKHLRETQYKSTP
jgi:hypothetical protein